MAEQSLRRGEVLGFVGLCAGTYTGYQLGKLTKNDTLEAALTMLGALGGVLGAHWFNKRPLTAAIGPEATSGVPAPPALGEVPAPYREIYPPWWTLQGRPVSRGEEVNAPWWPVMSRTVLVPAYVRSTWGASRGFEYAGPANCPWEVFGHFPRYALYGGPIRREHFLGLKEKLAQWAYGGRNLLGDGSPGYHACTVELPIAPPDGAVPFEWHWVWETAPSSRWQLVQASPVASGRWERRPAVGA